MILEKIEDSVKRLWKQHQETYRGCGIASMITPRIYELPQSHGFNPTQTHEPKPKYKIRQP